MAGFQAIELIDTLFSPDISSVDGFLIDCRDDTHFLFSHFIHSIPDFRPISRLVNRHRHFSDEYYIRSLSERVSALELNFLGLCNSGDDDRKYTWTAEIARGRNRKYELAAEIKPSNKGLKFEIGEEKRFRWTKEVRGGGREKKTVVEVDDVDGTLKRYKWKHAVKDGVEGAAEENEFRLKTAKEEKKKVEKKKKVVIKEECQKDKRLVKIDEVSDRGAVFLRQAFAKRSTPDIKRKGKRKELSSQDAAIMIQVTFRAYLIYRSQVLRALRELAVAKSKLKEIRSLFHNYTYHNFLAKDSEERQRFSEKIIVLLLTIDAIEGVDKLVRSVKRSMVGELEPMLDAVDPHPLGKSAIYARRRMFDMPSPRSDRKEIGAGVAKLVEIIEEEEEEEDEDDEAKCSRVPA